MSVFRLAGTVAVLSYSMAIVPSGIWFKRTWNTVFKEILDGVAYGVITGLAFAWLWPAL